MPQRHAEAVTSAWAADPAGPATATTDLLISLGAGHPSGHGMLRLRLALDGERVTAADPVIGYMHRGAEKLFEARDYRQIIVLANRHDWLGAFSSELGVALAAERLAGIEVPPRGVWARTLLAELNRVLSHLAFLSSYPPEIAGGYPAQPDQASDVAVSALAAAQARERLQAIMEEVSGGRMHYMFNRVGGLKEELPAGWLGRVGAVSVAVRGDLPRIGGIVRHSDPFRSRMRNVGLLTGEQVRQYGVSGPAARASGVDFDVRRDEPYLAYGELGDSLQVITRSEGDCLARFECLLDQVTVSLDLVDACASRLASLPRGPLSARIPKVLKIPEGQTYAWTEGPLGLSGYYLVSRGGKTPWRLKVRSASFSNVQVLGEVLPGHRVADLTAVLGSMFFVVGDIDR
ncbi:MAG TPA: NADH-quinone oxidoreductase subunit D [Streptosporangiaceae bacterium]|nr:NADH-quinone oxidoreductase subunit D [Streptosporangiaceae bacterium]